MSCVGEWVIKLVQRFLSHSMVKPKAESIMSPGISEKRPFTKVIIVGAGFSGLGMACQLQRMLKCHDYVIYDRSLEIGGTWSVNTCQSVRCLFTMEFSPTC
jgi:hypothetical protein